MAEASAGSAVRNACADYLPTRRTISARVSLIRKGRDWTQSCVQSEAATDRHASHTATASSSPRRPCLPLPKSPQRVAEITLCHRPVERPPFAGPLLEGRAIGRDRLLQASRLAFPFPQCLEYSPEVVLRSCPVEWCATARVFLKGGLVGGNRALQPSRPALPLAEPP